MRSLLFLSPQFTISATWRPIETVLDLRQAPAAGWLLIYYLQLGAAPASLPAREEEEARSSTQCLHRDERGLVWAQALPQSAPMQS